ncbi:hypothetical protein Bbelb_353110 [Branchiostoma belcheri]|nr:hypothetical protein Bbelb_353110 [Branchiostoma belcheri]
MKFYVFTSSARLVMERTILESFCPEENEITNADISSAYQTNSTRYGVSQAVFHKLFKECEDCQSSHLPVDNGEINTTQEANSTTQGDYSSDENNSDTSTDSDSSDEEDTSTDDESFNLFSHLGLKPMSSQSPHKRHRRLSQEDYQVYELPQDQLDKHLEDICEQHSVHLIVRKARKCKIKGTNGTIYEGKKKVFACHRSGAPNRKRKTKRKRQVSKKVGCSFRVKVLVPDNTDIPLKIYLHSVHSNHTPGSTEDQKWLPVDQRVLDIAADCLDAGRVLDVICPDTIPVHPRTRQEMAVHRSRKFAVYGSDTPVLHPPPRPKPGPLSGPVAPVPGTRCSHSRGPAVPVLGTPLHPLRGPPFPLPGLRCPAPEKSLPPLPGHISMF